MTKQYMLNIRQLEHYGIRSCWWEGNAEKSFLEEGMADIWSQGIGREGIFWSERTRSSWNWLYIRLFGVEVGGKKHIKRPFMVCARIWVLFCKWLKTSTGFKAKMLQSDFVAETFHDGSGEKKKVVTKKAKDQTRKEAAEIASQWMWRQWWWKWV